MNDKDKFVSSMQSMVDRYGRKLKKINHTVDRYSDQEKENLKDDIEHLKSKFEEAERSFQDIKFATEENWEEIKARSAEIFQAMQGAFTEFTGSLSIEHLSQMKDDVMDYGQEKLSELSNCIKKKPISAAAWALGIGFVIGKIFTRSK